MKKLELKARAKINLSLDILGKRPDNFHEVEMIMQSIELHDVVVLEESEGTDIRIIIDHPLLSDGASNIAYKAAKLFKERMGIKKGLKITIVKNIPVAAGLAGGSTDAAAVLKGLNSLWEVGNTPEQLAKLGAELGSDVPFCLAGGTSLATGRGEIITPLPNLPETWLVLAKPPVEVSTAEIYKNFDQHKVLKRPETKSMVEGLKSKDFHKIYSLMANVLESVTLKKYPVVSELKEAMKSLGLKYVLMSGSGPSVFGVADSSKEAGGFAERLKEKLPEIFVTVTRTCGEA